jgi:dTDP-4-amino-4,6-dideoxygalactose transaminase
MGSWIVVSVLVRKLETYNLNPDLISGSTLRPKAILAVHLWTIGEMEAIQLLQRNMTLVIEDAAQSHGAYLKKKVEWKRAREGRGI